MGKIILKKVITRKPGHLYYVDGAGNVCEAVMARGGKKRKGKSKAKPKSRTKKRVVHHKKRRR